MSIDPIKDRQLREAHVDRAVAENVAVGMAVQADAEATRADIEAARAAELAAQNLNQRAQVQDARLQRDVAVVDSAVAREEARNSSFATWLVLGAVAVALLITAIWFANRPNPTDSTVVINRDAPVASAPTAPSAPVQIQTPAPAPVVVDRPVPVDRPVAVPVPVPTPAAPPAPEPNRTIIIQPGNSGSGAAPAAGSTDTGGSTTDATTPDTGTTAPANP